MAANQREELHTLAEQLPEDATWDKAIDRLRFCQTVAEGKAAATRGEFATEVDVSRVFAKYGVEA